MNTLKCCYLSLRPHNQYFFQRLDLSDVLFPALPRPDEGLPHLAHSLKREWTEITIFPPKYCSVYKQLMRTNNDIEGGIMH